MRLEVNTYIAYTIILFKLKKYNDIEISTVSLFKAVSNFMWKK